MSCPEVMYQYYPYIYQRPPPPHPHVAHAAAAAAAASTNHPAHHTTTAHHSPARPFQPFPTAPAPATHPSQYDRVSFDPNVVLQSKKFEPLSAFENF